MVAQPSARISAMQWEEGGAPLSFTYGGAQSSQLLARWTRTERTQPAPGGELRVITYTDPATGIRLGVEVRTFADYDAVEWVARFSNGGQADTPILADILPLHWEMSVQVPPDLREDPGRVHDMGGEPPGVALHYARGSTADVNDFEPLEETLGPGSVFQIKSNGGRSSNGTMPFFNLQNGDRGVIGAIGWSGNWSARFALGAGAKSVEISAGMQRTRLRLHPGEEVRTPRILLLNWQGDRGLAHNLWRRLILEYYSPHEEGRPVAGPAFLATWGNEPAAGKLARIAALAERRVPLDVYWIDAGWYGNEPYKEGASSFTTPWNKFRGNWWPNPATYPQGLKPIGDLLRRENMGFLLWVEPGEADPGSTLLAEHPGWFLRPPAGASLLDLGNPEARKGITDIISRLIDSSGATWYREDFNTNPEGFWSRADPPDRIGITEMKYVEGLYRFWDDLVALHPGLKIDNCASGGRRIDLETISRSFALARTDLITHTSDPAAIPLQTEGISLWAPLTAGWCNGAGTYAMRSAYAAGLVVDAGIAAGDLKADEGLRQALDEFHQVRPYFYGDFYPLLPYSLQPGSWTAFQFHRRDLNGGIALFFRRKDSPITGVACGLHGLDPDGLYSVDIRTGDPGSPPSNHFEALGQALLDGQLEISLPGKPASALVLYQRVLQGVPRNTRPAPPNP